MRRAPPLAGQVQGHGRERKPRVSVPDGFIAPAGPRRAQGAGTPTQERAGVLHELLCDAGGGGVCKCLYMVVVGGDVQARPLGGAPLLQVP